MVELRVVLDVVPVVPVVPAPSPDAANTARGVADSNPAKSSEVTLMFIMVVSRDESLPDVGVKRRAVGFAQAALSFSYRVIG
jgi:hypothetical protein